MKDKTFQDFKIKVDLVREVKKIEAGYYAYKDKMYLVEIKYPYRGGGMAFSVKATGDRSKDLRKVFKTIMKNMYL